MKKYGIWALLFLCLTIFVTTAMGQSALPFRLQQNWITGLSLPVHLTVANDGSRRVFIVQQRGIIKVVQPGTNVTSDFMSLVGTVSSSGNERGLLGLAFHPQFAINRRFFVYYTRLSDGALEVAEYKTFTGSPNQGDPSTARPIITIPHTLASNHNGGTITFGPDGFLYMATGDGGSGDDPLAAAQNINSLLGKVLRIDIDPQPPITAPYGSPTTNPYVGIAGADEIYAIGMRNPYRYSFDRGGSHQLWVGDVGQDAIEEVDTIVLGGNYGWRVYEGDQCTGNDPGLCTPSNYLPRVFQYNSGAPDPRCSVTGGYVYRGLRRALPVGQYIYADYCTGEILLWNGATQTLQLDTARNISSFGEDEDGEIYVVGLGGTVDRIIGAKTSADFDGDRRTDISLYRPSDRTWYMLKSSNGNFFARQFGIATDIPVPEDFDGDSTTDIAVFRPSEGNWYRLNSSNNVFVGFHWGTNGDVPVAGDYDGDNLADHTVFRPSDGTWYTNRSSDNGFQATQFGTAGDRPTPGDFDGDGKSDIAVWRETDGVWYRLNSTNGSFFAFQFGTTGDIPAQGDFDGDGKSDTTVFRPSTGVWYETRSQDGSFFAQQFGANNDIPVAGDYDGDAKSDIAVFRPADGTWYVLRSSNGAFYGQQFGTSGDLPAPAYDKP
jgi:hypothetical protein